MTVLVTMPAPDALRVRRPGQAPVEYRARPYQAWTGVGVSIMEALHDALSGPHASRLHAGQEVALRESDRGYSLYWTALSEYDRAEQVRSLAHLSITQMARQLGVGRARAATLRRRYQQ